MTDYDTDDMGRRDVVILKGCARCGGDILTADAKNVRCLQCGYRPALSVAAIRRQGRRAFRNGEQQPVDMEAVLRILETPDNAPEETGEASYDAPDAPCPRCEETDSIALEKLRPHFNTCYRCRLCGHIFSPAEFKAAS